jgi:hypothetical protein
MSGVAPPTTKTKTRRDLTDARHLAPASTGGHMGKKKAVTERRITAAYNKVAAGITVDIMDIPRIWDAAEDAIKAGAAS